MKRLPKIFFVTLAFELLFCANVFAAKKDFKGLFGSYRREKFTENEAGSGEFGVDLMLSSLLPMTPVVQSKETTGGSFSGLNYATFFNVEGGIHYSLTYNWLLFASIGNFSYDTRKQTSGGTGTAGNSKQPNFHQFEMNAIPMLLGVKYRFSNSDIVPYLGVGAGFSRIYQKAFYDNSTQNKTRNFSAPTAEVVGGFEFYFAPKAGIRMEVSAFYMKVDQETWSTGGAIQDQPNFEFSGNIWSVRYASGLFFMF